MADVVADNVTHVVADAVADNVTLIVADAVADVLAKVATEASFEAASNMKFFCVTDAGLDCCSGILL